MWLDGVTLSEAGISEAEQTALDNLFAIGVNVSLLGGIGLAYDQFLWRMRGRKPLEACIIDTLTDLTSSP